MDFLFIQEQDQNPEIIPYACGKNAPCKGCSGFQDAEVAVKAVQALYL